MGEATVKEFEELHAYQQARSLANRVYEITKITPFSKDYGLVDQIRRAAVSVLSNIAEGFERGTNAELIQFLYIAKSSCGEVRAQLSIARDQRYLDERSYAALLDQCRRTSAMLNNLISYLKTSPYKAKQKKPPKKSPAEEMKEFLKPYLTPSSDNPPTLQLR